MLLLLPERSFWRGTLLPAATSSGACLVASGQGSTKGVAYDSFGSSARGEVARQFCLDFRLHREATFSISVYGEHGGLLLAAFWCSRMQFMYDRFLESGSEGVDLSQASMAQHRELESVTKLYGEGGARTRMRIEAIRSMRPIAAKSQSQRHMAYAMLELPSEACFKLCPTLCPVFFV